MKHMLWIGLLLPLLLNSLVLAEPQTKPYDVVVYGGTAGGIISAISVAKAGGSVIVLEPSDHIGGMVTGGLGTTDVGVGASIGGMAAEFYRRVYKHYEDPISWKFQGREEFLNAGGMNTRCVNGDRWWFPEPSVASAILRKMMSEAKVTVHTKHRLVSVKKEGARIVSIQCDNGATFSGRVFIDATYEGDLMTKSGIAYRIGRESSAEYGEKKAGVVPREQSTRKQWDVDVSPYDEKGRLLFGVQNVARGEDGAGDHKVQAYNFRICLTDHPDNRLPIEKPDDYDPHRYDLLARYIAAKPGISVAKGLLLIGKLPNRKTDINDGGPFSTDFIGFNWNYPDGDEQTRAGVIKAHLDYTKGLLYFIGHDPRVPDDVRKQMLQWGYPKDEYVETGHWSPQLYIREARRMKGAYVMTSHDIEENRTKDDSIGMASYKADSHLVQRIVDGKFVRNEGNPNDFTGPHTAYEVPYRAITPNRSECDNLLVTFCVSASHMAFASLRMEPVFMILSESAGIAAMEAAKADIAVQAVPYDFLRPKLINRNQLLKLEALSTPL